MPTRLDVIGQTGLIRFGSDVDEEWHRRLRGKKGARTYRQMRDNDPTIGSSLLATSSLVRQTPWTIEPADTPKGEEAAKFVDECRQDMSHTWADFMAEVVSCTWHGWALFEKVFKFREGPNHPDPKRRSKFDDGRIGWRKFSIRGQNTLDGWEFDDEQDDGGVRGMYQCSPPDFKRVFIPIEKALLFRTEPNRGNPEGRSMLRNAYRPFYFKTRMEEIEAIGIERDLVGLPYALMPLEYLDDDAPESKKNIAKEVFALIKKIRRNEQEGLVFPAEEDKDGKTGFKVGLMTTGGRRQIDTDVVITRYDKRIAMSLLTQWLFFGADKVGSFALSSDMTTLFSTALGAILDMIEDVINRFAVLELIQLNGFDPEDAPTIVHGDIEKEDVVRFAETLLKLATGGLLTPDATLEAFIRTRLELPEQDEPDEDMDVFGAGRDRSKDEPDMPTPDDDDDVDAEEDALPGAQAG